MEGVHQIVKKPALGLFNGPEIKGNIIYAYKSIIGQSFPMGKEVDQLFVE